MSASNILNIPTASPAYRAALDWLYSLSDTEQTGHFVRDREDNLARERALLAALDNPQRAYGITHVAGSRGKGSTSAMVAAILHAAGVRTGFYSSPDLHTFRERMRVDGQVMPEDVLIRLVPQVRAALEQAGDTLGSYITWEAATALAFLYFREARVAHAVIEVGLGGRLDATNVVEPLVTAITSISYEHMEILGHTLTEIAREKAGIVKPGVPLVCSAREPEAVAVIARICAERGAPLIRIGSAGDHDCDYRYIPGAFDSERQFFTIRAPNHEYKDMELALLGEHQLENATNAVALAEQLRAQGLPITEAAIRQGLREVRWPGRLQVVQREPWVVIDGAQNADSFAKLFAALHRHFPFERLLLILGVLSDKDIEGIAVEIARANVAAIIATAADTPRATAPVALAARLGERIPRERVHVAADVDAALNDALRLARPRDLVCVAGSLYLAAPALRWFAVRSETPPGSIEIAGVDH